ncbi:hypothetical protein [Halobacterium wangiae]|uniref:hypothetical protein n=1 Tax=Halobacterium wangiae TaxID=2902623 RepID=UPI001E2BD5D4|nr:hypothetical protein [Halobacterium wangiae]
MSDHKCPVEGCDFGDDEPRTRRSVLSHINAMSDSDHDKSAREAVEEGAPSALVNDTDDEEGEQDGERAESADERASDEEESDPEEGGMATPEEYEQQQTDLEGKESSDESDEEAPESGESENEESAQESGAGIPLNRQTLLLAGVALAVAGAYYWFVVRESDPEAPAQPAPSEDEDDEESAGEGAEAAEAGGLWDE